MEGTKQKGRGKKPAPIGKLSVVSEKQEAKVRKQLAVRRSQAAKQEATCFIIVHLMAPFLIAHDLF